MVKQTQQKCYLFTVQFFQLFCILEKFHNEMLVKKNEYLYKHYTSIKNVLVKYLFQQKDKYYLL